MQTIQLTQGKVVYVDDDVYEDLNRHRWCYTNGYACRRRTASKTGCHEYLHKRVMDAQPGDVIIHLDGDKLNCVRANMVRTNRKLRQQRMAARGASGYKGVSFRNGKYAAHIGVNGKTIHLGRFVEKDDAAREYDRAAVKYYGDKATLNFPQQPVIVQAMTREGEPTHA